MFSSVITIPAQDMNNTYASKENYQAPKYFTNETTYPHFVSGAGYILPWWTLPCLYQQSLVLPYFFIEDVFLTGWVGKKLVHYCQALWYVRVKLGL
jgi:hypothetical protein